MISDSISTKSIHHNDFANVIAFDNQYLSDVMREIGIPTEQLPPSLTIEELDKSYRKKDVLEWVFINNDLAGYYWFETKSDYLYIAGIVLKVNYYGLGLSQFMLNKAEQITAERNLTRIKLAVIPLNGRAINAYFKEGYQITECATAFFGPRYPNSFRLIMEKNLTKNGHGRVAKEECIIGCTDYIKLNETINKGYIGVRLIRSLNHFDNKICFIK